MSTGEVVDSERSDQSTTEGRYSAVLERYRAGESVGVTELPSWHAHPECGGLSHGHGEPALPPEPHTHQPVQAWGPAVSVVDDNRTRG